jgi:hypothetical protein
VITSVDRPTADLGKAGGLAALYLAAAYLVAMPFFLLVVDYLSVEDPATKVALLAANHASVHVMHLVTYVVFGLALAVLALALHQRLKTAAPALMQVATVVGLLWAFVLVASGLIFNAGMATVVGIYPSDPGRATVIWQTIEPISEGLSSAQGEILGGLWVLLVSVAGLRTGGLPRPLGWFGVVVGGVGLASVIPQLADAAIVFGLVQIAWFAWLGPVLLRARGRSVHVLAPGARPVQAS